jgi:hypothetical protein
LSPFPREGSAIARNLTEAIPGSIYVFGGRGRALENATTFAPESHAVFLFRMGDWTVAQALLSKRNIAQHSRGLETFLGVDEIELRYEQLGEHHNPRRIAFVLELLH